MRNRRALLVSSPVNSVVLRLVAATHLRSEPQPLDRTARELPAIHSQDAAIPRVGEEEIREPLRFYLRL